MKITDADLNTLNQYLTEKWNVAHRRCPVCQAENLWSISDTVFHVSEFCPGGGIILSGPTLPLICIVCTNCGYTIMVNAIIAGIVTPQSEQASSQEGPSQHAPSQEGQHHE